MAMANSITKKKALVIGNSTYEVNPLRSCVNDAEDIANQLKRADFNVTLGYNLTYTQISVMICIFTEKLTPEDLVVFFFSGHGDRLNEQNYLIAIDNQCIVDYPNLCKKHATCVQTTLDEIATKSPSAVILLLDCYREGIPSLTGTKTTSQRKSSMDFASIGNLQNSLIAYVCGPNQKSLDQSLNLRNSLFTHHLLQYLAEPNLRVEDIMFHVSTAVNKDSVGKLQVQWSSNLPTTGVYLNYTTESNVTTIEIDQCTQPVNADRNTTENDQSHRGVSPKNDTPNKPSKIMSSTLPKRILPRGNVQTNQHRTSVAHEQSFLLSDDRVRLTGLDNVFVSAARERNCGQSVLSRSRSYSNTVIPHNVQRLPSVAADDCDDFYSNLMMRQDTTKSRYSMSSLQDAPKIDRASTKSVDCKSAYSLDGSINLKQSHDTSRNRPSSVGSRIDHTSSSVLDVKQTHMADRPRSGVTKRDKKDQPTANIDAPSLISTSSSQLFNLGERTQVKSFSSSPKQISVDTQNGITAASHIQEETVTTPIIHQDPMIMSPRLNDQTDSKNTNLLAKRDDMKHLLRDSAFHKSALLPRPRLLSNMSTSVSKSASVDQMQRTDSQTAVGISIKATHSILPNSSHSEQDKSFHLQSIRPISPARNDNIPKIPLQSLELPSTEERKPINILLLGQTGVGKSTFINAFANYLYFSSLQQAETGKPRVLIPVSFLISSGFNFNQRTITFGPQHLSKNENFNDKGHSVTQQCCSYTFDLPERNQRVCIIDTPGFGDTRGIQQDEINIQHINEYITQLSHIDAICCLFKPNESKIDILFRTCFTQLFSVIGQDAYEKLMLCFTNSRSTFYAPGDTGPLLKKLLETVKAGREVKMEKNNTFCFDNEAFRFLVARQNGVEFTPNEEQEYVKSWDRSVKESQRLIDIILTEKSLAKQISALVRPILETIRNYLRNLILNEKNLSSDQIEVYLVKLEDISARCRKCPPCSEQISGFWINLNTPHYIAEDCVFCECSNDDHEQMKHFLRYRLKEQKSQNSNEMFDEIIEKLHSMAGIMTRFLAVDSRDSFEDPFLKGFQEMIDEETNQYRTKLNGELNAELSAQLQVQLKKYEDEVYGMEKRGEMIDIRRVNETVRLVKNLPMVSQLL